MTASLQNVGETVFLGVFLARGRVRRFSIFAFTASPFGLKLLRCREIGVKVSPRLPSPR